MRNIAFYVLLVVLVVLIILIFWTGDSGQRYWALLSIVRN